MRNYPELAKYCRDCTICKKEAGEEQHSVEGTILTALLASSVGVGVLVAYGNANSTILTTDIWQVGQGNTMHNFLAGACFEFVMDYQASKWAKPERYDSHYGLYDECEWETTKGETQYTRNNLIIARAYDRPRSATKEYVYTTRSEIPRLKTDLEVTAMNSEQLYAIYPLFKKI